MIAACRIGEFLPFKLKHISFDKYGTLLRVKGKTGDRRIRLVASTPALQTWLNDHPRKADPDAYLWFKIPTQYDPKNKTDHLSYGFIVRLLSGIAEKTGVKKNMNPKCFQTCESHLHGTKAKRTRDA